MTNRDRAIKFILSSGDWISEVTSALDEAERRGLGRAIDALHEVRTQSCDCLGCVERALVAEMEKK